MIHNNEWWFSIIDVIEVLSGTDRPRKYWSDLKKKMGDEGYIEVSEKIGQLKMESPDGKMRKTDCANTETMFRFIQSIPSPKAAFGVTPGQHKSVKGLKRQNLRDHMTDLELIFSMLEEAGTTEITRVDDAKGFNENKKAARKGGGVAGKARKDLEKKTGKRVVSNENYLTTPEKKKRLKGK